MWSFSLWRIVIPPRLRTWVALHDFETGMVIYTAAVFVAGLGVGFLLGRL